MFLHINVFCQIALFYRAWVRDSKNEKVYHFHVESGISEYVLMPPRESSEPQASESPRRLAQRNKRGGGGGMTNTETVFTLYLIYA